MKVIHGMPSRFFRTFLALMTLMLLVAGEASAQNAGVRGRVEDENGQPLEGVEIFLEKKGGGRTAKVSTNAKGEFVKAGLRVGTYKITYSLEGYETALSEFKVSFGAPRDLGTMTLPKLPEGVLGEKAAKAAQQHLDAATEASGKEDHQATIESLQKFVERVPDSGEAYYNIAAAYEKLGDQENALSNYRKATELRPNLYMAWVAMGTIYGAQEHWQEGMAAFEKGLELKPNELVVRFNYGVYAANAGDDEKAQQAFEKVTEIDPDYALAHYQLAVVIMSQGKTDEAVPHFEKYLELEPEGAYAAAAKQILESLKKN